MSIFLGKIKATLQLQSCKVTLNTWQSIIKPSIIPILQKPQSIYNFKIFKQLAQLCKLCKVGLIYWFSLCYARYIVLDY